MKAAIYYKNGGPEVFEYAEVPTPVAKNGEVLIKIKSISIEGGDSINRESRPLYNVPNIVGYQCAGDIVAVGDSVNDRLIGQRVVAVTSWGSHAEYIAAKASMTFVLPDMLSYEEGSAIPTTFFTAHECLFSAAKINVGDVVLVHGASGALGIAAIQLAKKAGAKVIATGSDNEKLQRLISLGADHLINYNNLDVAKKVMEITKGKGAILIIDPVGGKNILECVKAAAYKATIVTVGVSGRDKTLFDPVELWRKNLSLKGIYMPTVFESEHERYFKTVSSIIEDVANGKLKVIIDRKFALKDVQQAYEYLLDRKSFGRVLLIP